VKYISHLHTITHQNAATCTVYEYGDNGKSDIARAVINGRYPEKNFAVNEQSSMTVFVVAGIGMLTTKDSSVSLSKGDVLFIDNTEAYFYEGENLDIVMYSSPVWSPEQYKEVA